MFINSAIILIFLFMFQGKDSSSVNHYTNRPTDQFYERALRAGLLNIEQEKLSSSDIEIRVWERVYATKNTPSAFVLRMRNGVWSALRLESDSYSLGRFGYILDELFGLQTGKSEDNCVIVPKHSWDELYDKLNNTGFFTLPDDSTLNKKSVVMDGVGYFVETRFGAKINRYFYDNPQYVEFPEQQKFLDGLNILTTELVDE